MRLNLFGSSRFHFFSLTILVAGITWAPIRGAGPAGPVEDAFPPPEKTRADEPLAKTVSLAKGAEYIDRAAIAWLHRQNCSSCHSSYSQVMARAVLGDLKAPALARIKGFMEERVAGWDRGGPGKGFPAEEDEAATEVVATAVTLAFHDGATGGRLGPITRKALDRMWSLQRADGSWNWNKHDLPPQELDEYYGAVFAAVGVGQAPEGYSRDKSALEGVERLRKYLRENPPPNLHHQTMLLWASHKLDGLLEPKGREKIKARLLDIQRKDGGWNLPSLGGWKRMDGTPNDPDGPSDGYATGLVTYVLMVTGTKPDDPALTKSLAWLRNNQRESGRWFTRSVNADHAHYITNAGTAYALMALKVADGLRP